MAKWIFTRPDGPWQYPTLGFTAVAGDVIENAAAIDPWWEPADPGAAVTIPATPGGGVIEPAAGSVLTYDRGQNSGIWTPFEDLGIYTEEELTNKIVSQVGAAVPSAVETALVDNPEVLAAAAEGAAALAQADAGLLRAVEADDLADDERGLKVDGDEFYGVRWNADGLTSNFGPGTRVVELAADQGYTVAFIGSNGRLVLDSIDITGAVVPVPRSTTTVLSPVVLEGDSMVGNWAANSGTLSSALGGRSLIFRGDGGKQSPWIAGRAGGRPLLLAVTGDELPATGAVSGTLAFPPLQASVSSGLDMVTGTYVGIVQGRKVSIAITSAAGACTVTIADTINRTTPCPPGAPFKTGLDILDHWPIIWAGRNNFYQPGDEQQIVNDIRGILEHSRRKDRALVLSIVPQVGETLGSETSNRRLARNARLAQEFPDQYEDVASRLRSPALLQAVGITPTTQDTDDIAAGYTPASFRADSLHLNAKGYEALALLIRETYIQRGWQ